MLILESHKLHISNQRRLQVDLLHKIIHILIVHFIGLWKLVEWRPDELDFVDGCGNVVVLVELFVEEIIAVDFEVLLAEGKTAGWVLLACTRRWKHLLGAFHFVKTTQCP